MRGTGEASAGFILAVALWLWFTVLFANFAEALAEGRSKAQAAALRGQRREILAKKLYEPRRDAQVYLTAASQLGAGSMVVLVEAGDLIPSDGEVIAGTASVDESAITGESAPVIRESGGDFGSVTGGTRVLSDWLIVRVTVNPGETFLDRMIRMVESARRQKTPNEIALTILLVALTLVFLLVTVTLLPFSLYSIRAVGAGTPVTVTVLIALLVCLIPTTIGALLSAIGIAGMGRMLLKNVIATSGRAVEAAGDVDVLLLDKTGTITLGNRQAIAFIPAAGVSERDLADAAQLASLADETPEGRSITVLAKKRFNLRERDVAALDADLRPVLGADPHERSRCPRAAAAQGCRRRDTRIRRDARAQAVPRKPSARPKPSRGAAAHRCWWPRTRECWALSSWRMWSRAASRSASRSCAAWGSGR